MQYGPERIDFENKHINESYHNTFHLKQFVNINGNVYCNTHYKQIHMIL